MEKINWIVFQHPLSSLNSLISLYEWWKPLCGWMVSRMEYFWNPSDLNLGFSCPRPQFYYVPRISFFVWLNNDVWVERNMITITGCCAGQNMIIIYLKYCMPKNVLFKFLISFLDQQPVLAKILFSVHQCLIMFHWLVVRIQCEDMLDIE